MKIKWGINAKILVYILSTTLLTFTITIAFISLNNRKIAIANAEEIALKTANENAIKIEKELSGNLVVLRTLAQAFSVYEDMEEEEWKALFLKMYHKVYAKNDDIYKLWDSWELKYFDPNWNKDYGRYTVSLYKQNNQIFSSVSDRSLDGDSEGYAEIKNIAQDILLEPYWDEFTEGSEEKMFMTSLASPIFKNNKYAGIVGADIVMAKLQEISNEISLPEGSTSYLISNSGIFAAHPDPSYIGQKVSVIFSDFDKKYDLSNVIKKGLTKVFHATDENNTKILVVCAPIQVGTYISPWSLSLIIPYSAILADANRAFLISLLLGFLGMVLISIIIIRIAMKLSADVNLTKTMMNALANGELDTKLNIDIKRNDEIEDIAHALNSLKAGLNNSSTFAMEMGKGILDTKFKPLGDKDILGHSLLNMRESLMHNADEEKKRKIEDEKRNWATQGLAKFGEILRSNSNSIKELSFNVMRNLVNYLELNQGALFVVEEEDGEEPMLVLKTAIAYNRDKFMQKRLVFGESLVGRAAFEMKSIYMTQIPDNYIQISSGMGTANPTNLLIVPLILNDEVFGVIEVASFKSIEPYQIEFLERLGESIASTIASVKVNEKTSLLLNQSKKQAEELAAQEEEMRQNLEELQATQEEAARREFEMHGVVNALGTTAFTVEYDLDGTILGCNEKYADMLGMTKEKIIGQKHKDGYDENSEIRKNYDLFWNDLCKGISKKQVNRVSINNRDLWIEETYTPINELNETLPYKILKIGFDITEQKNRELKLQEQHVSIKKERLLLAEYNEQIKELKTELDQANEKIKLLETKNTIPALNVQKASNQSVKEPRASGDNLLDWTEEFVLGIEELDSQHEQLIALANILNASYLQNKNKKELKENLRSLIDFASYHFGTEEQYFNEFEFSESENHIADHDKLLKELMHTQTAFQNNKIKELDNLLAFIKNWLSNHFTIFDTAYVDLFKSNEL